MRLSAWLLMAALASAACRKAPQGSPEYEEARARWTELLKDKGIEAAYRDPGSEEVLQLLGRVDPASADRPYAGQLRAEIEAGRREALDQLSAQEKREQERREAAARAASAMAVRPAELTAGAANASSAQEASDAGAAGDQPRVGMEADHFKRDFARCFEYKHPAIVQGRSGGEIWGLKDLMICRDLHQSFVSSSVLLMDGKVLSIRPTAELAPKQFQVVDGKLVETAPDAGTSTP